LGKTPTFLAPGHVNSTKSFVSFRTVSQTAFLSNNTMLARHSFWEPYGKADEVYSEWFKGNRRGRHGGNLTHTYKNNTSTPNPGRYYSPAHQAHCTSCSGPARDQRSGVCMRRASLRLRRCRPSATINKRVPWICAVKVFVKGRWGRRVAYTGLPCDGCGDGCDY
jgi:hypothetical protein